MGLRVLITNNTAGWRAGTELYVLDLATALIDRGHTPIVFSTHLGQVTDELRTATVPVIDRLEMLADPPDVIHGHHHVDTLISLLHFARTPGIFVCHGWLPWEETPPKFSRIRRYLAVDETCRDRLACEHGIPRDDVEVLLNFVDLNRFRPRAELPERPRKALIFSNAAEETNYVTAVREACHRHGITLDVRGAANGNAIDKPEAILGGYDVVFAKARAALEAMAVGTAVVLCDAVGAGPLVTTTNLDTLRPLNFGIRTLRRPHTADHFAEQLTKYNRDDARRVSTKVRQTAGRDDVVDRLIEIYGTVIAEHEKRPAPEREAEERELSGYLQWLAPRAVDVWNLNQRVSELTADRLALEQQRDQLLFERLQLKSHVADSSEKIAALSAKNDLLTDHLAAQSAERAALDRELLSLQQTATWRLHCRLRDWPLVAGPLRHLARFLAGALPRRAS